MRYNFSKLTQIEIDHYLTFAHFTDTERAVFLLLCDGFSTTAIEERLHMSEATVGRNKTKIYDKIVRVLRYKPLEK